MQIDGTGTNGASARQGNLGNAHTGDERTQDPKTGAHARDHLVGCRCIDDISSCEMECFAEMSRGTGSLAIDGKIDAVVPENTHDKIDVREIGHVLER